MANKLIALVGYTAESTPNTFQPIYLAEVVESGTRFIVRATGDGTGGPRLVAVAKSAIETQVRNGQGELSASVTWASLLVAPAATGTNGEYLFTNATPAEVLALINAAWGSFVGVSKFQPFAQKGNSVGDLPADRRRVDSDNADLYFLGLLPAPAVNTSGAGSNTTPPPPPAPGGGKPPALARQITGIEFVDTVLLFFWDNPILLAIGVFLLMEAFGITNFLGKILGKKNARRGRR